ncbi:GNAT family N-acetyltransferase [Bacillus altitudinis]|uniref:GNAT family N-acetyltransferase n=1 Tax=Bacillus altitudinis TaxID=293387 RepID=UPI00064CA45C|nr:GNAT family N-acetyltransferase [Bacillus altitudinis]KLV14426.1 GNAT family acetyltransferase [Bacillus altitudinis]
MIISESMFTVRGVTYRIRSAALADAKQLSTLRLKIDGETEYLDREPGEAFIDEKGFEALIQEDSNECRHLFLVADIEGDIVGFSRCEGHSLKRSAHKVTFGVAVQKAAWGYHIGKELLAASIDWADQQSIQKMSLEVLETNQKAIRLYEHHGFLIEGVLKNDKRLADGLYYNTVVMGRQRPSF